MAVFAVFLQEGPPEAHLQIRQRIESRYPRPEHHQMSDNLYLVRSDSIADEVARTVGIKGEEGKIENATGVVFKLNAAYAGFASRAIWEWLALAERE